MRAAAAAARLRALNRGGRRGWGRCWASGGAPPAAAGPPGPPARPREHVLLVDATGAAFRAYSAAAASVAREGPEAVSTLHLWASALVALLERERPSHAVVVFDAGGTTFRHALYAEYKAHRPASPEGLGAEIDAMRALTDALGVARVELAGVEADDLIATLAARAARDGLAVSVASADSDFFQLLGLPHTQLLRPHKPPYTAADFAADFEGLRPEQYVDVLALCGDRSDNVPGVAGIGKKTAPQLLAAYGDLDGVFAAAATAEPKRARAKLAAEGARERARMSRRLVELRADLAAPQLERSWEEMRVAPPADGGAALRAHLRAEGLARVEGRLVALGLLPPAAAPAPG